MAISMEHEQFLTAMQHWPKKRLHILRLYTRCCHYRGNENGKYSWSRNNQMWHGREVWFP